jgi:hypothetical protein
LPPSRVEPRRSAEAAARTFQRSFAGAMCLRAGASQALA